MATDSVEDNIEDSLEYQKLSESHDALKRKVTRLKKKRTDMKKDRDNVEQVCKHLQESLSSMSTKYEEACQREKDMFALFEERHVKAREALATSSTKLRGAIANNEKLSSDLQEMGTTYNALAKTNKHLSLNRSDTDKEFDKCRTELEYTSAQVTDLKTQLSTCQRSLDDALQREKLLQSKNDIYKTELTTIQTRQLDIEVQLDTATTDLERVQSSSFELTREVEHLRTRNASLVAEQQHLVEEDGFLRAKIEQLTLALAVHECDLTEMTGERDALKKIDEKRKTEIDALVKNAHAMQRNMEALKKTSSRRLDAAIKTNGLLESRSLQAVRRVNELEAEADKTRLQQERDELKKLLGKLKSDLSTARNLNDSASAKENQLESERQGLEDHCVSLQTELEHCKRKMSILSINAEELTTQHEKDFTYQNNNNCETPNKKPTHDIPNETNNPQDVSSNANGTDDDPSSNNTNNTSDAPRKANPITP